MTTNKLTGERLAQYANDPLMCVSEEVREMARMLLAAQAHITRQEQIIINQDESLSLRRAELQEYRKAELVLTVDDCVRMQARQSIIPTPRLIIPVLPDYVFHTMAVRWPLTAEQLKRLCRELQLEMEKHTGQSNEQA